MKTLAAQGNAMVEGIEARCRESIEFINSHYPKSELLEKAASFIAFNHSDAVNIDMEALSKLGYYPATEVEMEFDHATKHALVGSYKAAFADLRRGLELTIISAFLTSEKFTKEQAREWLTSKKDTPRFSNALKSLSSNGRFKELDNDCEWVKDAQILYWSLSDYSHNKGTVYGYRELNRFSKHTGSTTIPSVNTDTLSVFCDLYLQTAGHIITLLALCNPIILVGVPIDMKLSHEFDSSSGYFNDFQAALVHSLLPDKYKEFFQQLAKNDEEVRALVNEINSMPDVIDDFPDDPNW